MKLTIVSKDKELRVVAHESYSVKDELKRFGFKWDQDLKAWYTTYSRSLRELAKSKNINISEKYLANGLSTLFKDYRIELFKGGIFLYGNTYPIKEELKRTGFKWNPESSCYAGNIEAIKMNWEYLIKTLPKDLVDILIDLKIEPTNDKLVLKDSDNVTLYDHQKEGVQFIHDRKMCLLNWEMGAGKTFTPIAYAHSTGLRLFAIVPAITQLNFYRECVTYGLTSSIYPYIRSMRKKYRERYEDHDWEDSDTSVSSYTMFNIQYKKTKHENVSDIVSRYDMLVLDESQYIMNYKAQRTKAVLSLIDAFKAEGKKIVFLTGTPLKSRPVELYTTLKAINPNMEGYMSFAKRYNGAVDGHFGLVLGRATNTEDLYNRMKSFTSRLKKEDCLDLPSKTRNVIDIDGTVVIHDRPDPKDFKIHLTFLTAYRIALAKAKVNSTIKLVSEMADNDPILVFTAYVDVNNAIADGLRSKGLDVAQIHSGAGGNRDEIVQKFQDGHFDVLVGNIRAMGIGITLTRASNSVFNDMEWTPADLLQAEDRIHRVGQTKPVTIHYMISQDDFDQAWWSLLNIKFRDITAVMDNEKVSGIGDVFKTLKDMFWKK